MAAITWAQAVALLTICDASGQTNQITRRGDQLELFVEDPRPVAKAIELLGENFPYLISYEDPIFSYDGDLQDVNRQARPDVHSGSSEQVFIPRRSQISVTQPVSSAEGEPLSLVGLLQSILNSNDSNGSGARFRVEQTGEMLHVTPLLARDAAGLWKAQTSVLDVRITLARQKMTGSQMLQAICAAVTEATGVKVGIGNAPLNAVLNYEGEVAANDERARDVLVRTLHAIDDRYTWFLLYGPSPSDRMYYLNVRRILGGRTAPETPLPVPPRQTGPLPTERP